MHVEHERRVAQRSGTQFRDSGQIEALEHRVHRDAFAAAQKVGEIDRHFVDEDQIHLGVRDAQRLDPVLHRRGAVELVLESVLAPYRRQKSFSSS